MEWHALPHHCGFDFDIDTKTGYLTKFVVAPSSPGGEWAGLIRLFQRDVDQKPWDLKRTYLDVEAEFVTCQLQLIATRDGGLVVHLLSRSGKRGSLIIMNKKLAEVADKAKNFASVVVDKVKDCLYCVYNSRSEGRAQLELYKDISLLTLNLKVRCPLPKLKSASQICIQGNCICVSGIDTANNPIASVIRKDTLQAVNCIDVKDPLNLWFDSGANLIEIMHNNDKSPLKLRFHKGGVQHVKLLPKMKKSKLTLFNDRDGKLYVNIKTNNEKLSNLFGPIELLFSTFHVEEQTLLADGTEVGGDKSQITLKSKAGLKQVEKLPRTAN